MCLPAMQSKFSNACLSNILSKKWDLNLNRITLRLIFVRIHFIYLNTSTTEERIGWTIF